MLLRITKKLAEKFKISSLPEGDVIVPHLEEWYSNLFIWNRKQYIVFTNAGSLYSVIIDGKGISDPEKLVSSALFAIADLMRSQGDEKILSLIAHSFETFTLYKTNSRSVLGSMNEIISQAKTFLSYQPGISLNELSMRVNSTLYKYKTGYEYPAEAIRNIFGINAIKN